MVEQRDVDVGERRLPGGHRRARRRAGRRAGRPGVQRHRGSAARTPAADRCCSSSALVVIAAGLFGWWLARRITRRLVRLTRAAEDVAGTGRLGIQVPVAGDDEVGRLGRAFDRMLGRLAQSEEDQRRLVQDAGPRTAHAAHLAAHEHLAAAPHRRAAARRARGTGRRPGPGGPRTDRPGQRAGRPRGRPVGTTSRCSGWPSPTSPRTWRPRARRRTGRDVTVRATGDTVVEGRPGAPCSGRCPTWWRTRRSSTGTAPGRSRSWCEAAGTGRPRRGSATGASASPRRTSSGSSTASTAPPDARSLPGSGLGLSIVREVAPPHGGAPFALAPGGRRVGDRVHGERGRRGSGG